MRSYSLFIGIDISKKWIDACLTIDGKIKQMPHSRFDNNVKGFKSMLDWIKQSPVYPKDFKKCVFCMEHTGVYTLPICRFLQKKSLKFVLESPYHLKRSLGIRRDKSDIIDAAHIARYTFLYSEELKLTSMPSDSLLKIRNLLSLRNRLVNSRKSLVVAAKELKDFASPRVSKEVIKYTKDITQPIGISIKAVEKQILMLIEEDAELSHKHDLVTSVKGVGLIISAALLVYTVGFTAFENSRKFATYIGLTPFSRKSGTSINVPAKVSHLAHKKLKGLISCGASSAMNFDRELNAYYQRRIAEGKNKYTVQNAIRNKFVHRIFAVVKRGTPYVELAQHRV